MWKQIFGLFVILLCGWQTVHGQTEDTNFGNCKTPNNQPGACKYIRACHVLLNLLLQTPLTSENRQFLSRSQCGYYNRSPLVCCPPPTVSQPDTAKTGIPIGRSLLPEPGQCGVDVQDRIVGGIKTRIDEYIWMALLAYSKPTGVPGHHCGGVLINNLYVVTASHCVNGKDLPKTWTLSGVRLGEWDTTTDPDCDDGDCALPHIDVPIATTIPHPGYQPASTSQANDIALLRLAYPVTFSDFIMPICLPRTEALRNNNLFGQTMFVAGWGKTESTFASNIKLKVNVTGVPTNECNAVYSRQNVQLGDGQLCAGGAKGKDSCRGDSGGPLMKIETYPQPHWFLAGVVSFGPTPCGTEGWPGVYTRITSYIEWIENTIQP